MKKRILPLVMLSLFALPTLASCGNSGGENSSTTSESTSETESTSEATSETESTSEATSENDSQEFTPFTITDLIGRSHTFNKPVKRVACLGMGALRLYSYVGDMNKLAAVEDMEKNAKSLTRAYTFANQELFKSLPSCGLGGAGVPSYDYELLINLNLDAIFTCDNGTKQELDSRQDSIPTTPLVVINYGKNNIFNDPNFNKSLEIIDKISGNHEKYNSVTTYISDTLTNLKETTLNIEEKDKKTVFFGGVGKKSDRGLRYSQKSHPILKAVNAKNVLDNENVPVNGNTIDPEFINKINPDVTYIDGGGYAKVLQDLADPSESKNYTNWESLRNGNTYVMLPYRDANMQGELGLINAMFVRSTAFASTVDVPPFALTTIGNEVFSKFYGSEDGVFYKYFNSLPYADILFEPLTLVK